MAKKEFRIPERGERKKQEEKHGVHYTSYRIPIEVARAISRAARSASLKLTKDESDEAISQTEAVIQILEQSVDEFYVREGIKHASNIVASKTARAEPKEKKTKEPKVKKVKAEKPKKVAKAAPKAKKAAPKAAAPAPKKSKKKPAQRAQKPSPLDSPEVKKAKEAAAKARAEAKEAKKKGPASAAASKFFSSLEAAAKEKNGVDGSEASKPSEEVASANSAPQSAEASGV